MKKILSLILSVLMIISIIPIGMFVSFAVNDEVNYTSLTTANATQNIEFDLSGFNGLADADKKVTLSFTYNQGGAKGGSQTTLSVNGTTCLSRGNGNRGFRIWGANATNGNSNAGAKYNITITVDYTGNAVVTYDIVSGATKASVGLTKKTTISNNKIVFALNTSNSGDTFTNIVFTKPHSHSYTIFEGNVEDNSVNKEKWKCASDDSFELREHTLVTDLQNSSDTVEAWKCSNIGCNYTLSITGGHNFSTEGEAQIDGTHYACLNDNCLYEKVVASSCVHEFDLSKSTFDESGEHFYCSKCKQTLDIEHDLYIKSTDDTVEYWACHNDNCTYTKNINHTIVIDFDAMTDDDETYKCTNDDCTYTKAESHDYLLDSQNTTKTVEKSICQNQDCGHIKTGNHAFQLSAFDKDAHIATLTCTHSYCKYTYDLNCYLSNNFDGSVTNYTGSSLSISSTNATDIDSDGDKELPVTAQINQNRYRNTALPANMTYTFDIRFPEIDADSIFPIIADRDGGNTQASSYLVLVSDADGNMYIQSANSSDKKMAVNADTWYSIKIVFPDANSKAAITYAKLTSSNEDYVSIGSHSNVKVYETTTYDRTVIYIRPITDKTYYLDNYLVYWPYDCTHKWVLVSADASNEVFECSICGLTKTGSHAFPTNPTTVDADGERYNCTNANCTYIKTVNHKMVVSNSTTDDVEIWECSHSNCSYTYNASHDYDVSAVTAEGTTYTCKNDGCGHSKFTESSCKHNLSMIASDDDGEHYKCSVCQETFTVAHDIQKTTDETNEYYVCQNDGCEYEKTIAHHFVLQNTTDKNKEYLACDNDGCTYNKSLNHNFELIEADPTNGLHYRCSNSYCLFEYTTECSHIWEYQSENAGKFLYICSLCDKEEYRSELEVGKGNTTSDDFDGNKKVANYGMTINYNNSQIVNISGNNVFYPNGVSGTTTIGSISDNPIPYGSTMTFKIKVDNGVENGQTLALLYDKILANKSDESSRLNGSILGITTVGGVSYLFGGKTTADKYQISYDTWYQVVISFKTNSSEPTRVYIKGINDRNYSLIGTFGGSANIGVSQSTGDLYYFVSRDANYYIDDFKITDSVEDFVKVEGYQKTDVENGKYNARFVLGISGIFECQDYIGVDVVCKKYDKEWLDRSITMVYNSISSNYGTSSITAESLGVSYVTAVTVTGIPSSIGRIELELKPFTVINNVKVYGKTTYLTVAP